MIVPSMSRKQFELIARVLKEAREEHECNFPTHNLIAHKMAKALASTNSQFDRDKFLKACGFVP